MNTKMLSMCALLLAAGNAFGGGDVSSLRINEAVTNPKADDAEWEYIEIFGCPDTVLNDLALIAINYDTDTENDEVDEAFVFPSVSEGVTYQTNSEGYFVIWNTSFNQLFGPGSPSNHASNSGIYGVLPNSITQGPSAPINSLTTRHEASFIELQSPTDVAGKISNDGSVSLILLENFVLSEIDKDSVIVNDMNGDPDITGDVIDEIAYADSGRNEYTFDEANEFDYTPGFNPGYLIRVADIRDGIVDASLDLDAGSGTEPYRDAFSNFYMGEIGSNPVSQGDPFLGDNDDSYGAGTYDDSVSPHTFVPMSALNGVQCTPGTANQTFSTTRKQITSSGCPAMREQGDSNGDGVVDIQDLILESQNGDYNSVIRVLNSLGR